LYILSFLSPKEICDISLVNSTWKAYTDDNYLWQSKFKDRWGCINSENWMFLYNLNWKDIFRMKYQLEKQWAVENPFLTAINTTDKLHKLIKKTHIIEQFLNNSKNIGQFEDLFHCFLYEEYTSIFRLMSSPPILKNYARRLVTHSQSLKKRQKLRESEKLVIKAINACELIHKKTNTNENEPANYQGFGQTWANSLMCLAQIQQDIYGDSAKADEYYLNAQKILLLQPEKDVYRAFNLACIFSLCNQPDQCKKWLEEAYTQRNLSIEWLEEETDFRNVENLSWYRALVSKLKDDHRRKIERESKKKKSSNCIIC